MSFAALIEIDNGHRNYVVSLSTGSQAPKRQCVRPARPRWTRVRARRRTSVHDRKQRAHDQEILSTAECTGDPPCPFLDLGGVARSGADAPNGYGRAD